MTISWADFKSKIDTGCYWYQLETPSFYFLKILEGPFCLDCSIAKTDPISEEQRDFEENYKK